MYKYILVFMLVFYCNAQTSLNPNISVVGDLRYLNFTQQNDAGKHGEFQFRGLELVVENYLNPFARADVTIHFSDEELVDIEEAYITILKGLPFNSQIRFGRYFLPFGEILQKHEHVNSFISYPSLHQSYFGEEGVRNLGFELNFAFPLFDQFTELKLGILEGNLTPEEEGEEAVDEEEALPCAYSAYYSIFASLSDFTNLKTSFSFASGATDIDRNYPINLFAIAAKLKWKPSAYKSFQFQGELFINDRTEQVPDDTLSIYPNGLKIKNSGFFLSSEYQFSKFYSVGASYSQFTEPTGLERLKRKDFSLYATYAPVEETMVFRFKFSRDVTFESNQFAIQTIFSLGPHKAHQF
ncbi:MAG: hypothetical protein KDD94_08155 [Calditrichaeota bacterium]|nr:hypothetical protein [Calditrichota bacterium]